MIDENKVLAIEKYELPILLCTILKKVELPSLALEKMLVPEEPINKLQIIIQPETKMIVRCILVFKRYKNILTSKRVKKST
jgi:hypothetical protein